MSDFVPPHRWQPTKLCHPWDSPGKNTGVGCRFLLQCMKVKSGSEVVRSCPTLCDPIDCSPPGSSIHGIFPGKSTGVGCHCLLRKTIALTRWISVGKEMFLLFNMLSRLVIAFLLPISTVNSLSDSARLVVMRPILQEGRLRLRGKPQVSSGEA